MMETLMLEELQRKKLESELAESQASTRKIEAEILKLEAEARNLKLQNDELAKQPKAKFPITASELTVLLGLFTLIGGGIEFYITTQANLAAAAEARSADSSKQWKLAVASVDYEGEAKSIGAALTLETYFDDPLHGKDAKSIVASILPYLSDKDEFDHLFNGLYRHTGWGDEDPQLYTVAKAVAVDYGQQADQLHIFKNSRAPIAAQGRFVVELSNQLADAASTLPPKDAAEGIVAARRREWEIDTITHGLVDFWKANGTRPPQANDTYSPDLETLILRFDNDGPVDLTGMDFRHAFFKGAYLHNVILSQAHLEGATLIDANLARARLDQTHLEGVVVNGANLGCIANFEGSRWDRVEWWNASQISPALVSYLQKVSPAPPATVLPPAAAECNKTQGAPQ